MHGVYGANTGCTYSTDGSAWTSVGGGTFVAIARSSGFTLSLRATSTSGGGQIGAVAVPEGALASCTARAARRLCVVLPGSRGQVAVRTFGHPGLRVVVVHRAPAANGYRAYLRRTIYVDGVQCLGAACVRPSGAPSPTG